MRYTPRELRHPISLYAFINLLTRFHSYFLTWFPVELKYSEFTKARGAVLTRFTQVQVQQHAKLASRA